MVYRLVIKTEQIADQQIRLDKEQQHYLLRVLRLGNGDRFIVLDGAGSCWWAEITEQSAKILESVEMETELPVEVSLITAVPKGSGYEQILRCCTELGVSKFIPVMSDRTILKPSLNKVQRWRKIVIEAAEQSERQIVPVVFDPVKYDAALTNTLPHQTKYICVARGDLPSLGYCLQNQSSTAIVVATGCEGGWTDKEVETAISHGFQPVSLGNRILRAITAPITASSLIGATSDMARHTN